MSDFIARYAAARKAAIARDFAKLNPEQRRGVLTTEGALLLLAARRRFSSTASQIF